jgi:Transposase DDE domain
MAAALAVPSVRMLRPSPSSVDGLHNGTSPPARRRSTKKNGGDQALGRSRGGLSTKIHAATIDENCSVALHLTAGDAHEGRQFESLYESLDPDNVLESATMDKGYDADRIPERLSYERSAGGDTPDPNPRPQTPLRSHPLS